MHSSTNPNAIRARAVTRLDTRPQSGVTAIAWATRALLIRPGKRKAQALAARLDAVRQRIQDLD